MRGSSGATLVELMIASLIMTFISTAFLGIILTTYKASSKVSNMTDTAAAVRQIKERLGQDIRAGRTLGDVYGTKFWDPSPNAVGAVQIRNGVDVFPGPQNPVYGAGQAPPSGWPAEWTGGGVNGPYRLSNTCLIVQIPIGDNHNDIGTLHRADVTKKGWPTAIYPTSDSYPGFPGPGNPAVTTVFDNVETHVYMVLPDNNNPGEYKLEWCSFPGYAVPGYIPAAHSMNPQVLLTGLIGPKDAQGNLKIFQFLSKTDTTSTPRDTILPSAAYVANYTGVVVNLELRTHNESKTTTKNISVQPVGFKTEIFLRNNAVATTNGGG